ncbi:expressed unknown protein [Ectocarpus siliculosus]|uniref:Uncharacterized protein n=1 Tax=Ectocarpus siliculosus TaxID=2880 RepID=D7G0U9_ECTSI|nr:expressed unknown protein [Ectocarpus siliculosus]|eukprot:CBJ26693.1 expressed unknown protein [Ectocarpus siliculosus]
MCDESLSSLPTCVLEGRAHFHHDLQRLLGKAKWRAFKRSCAAATGGENEWYDKQWKAGACHGQGGIRFAGSGDMCVGSWVGNQMHGKGKIVHGGEGGEDEGTHNTSVNCVGSRGVWDNGQLSGQATAQYNYGNRYTGGFERGRRSGEGTMFAATQVLSLHEEGTRPTAPRSTHTRKERDQDRQRCPSSR